MSVEIVQEKRLQNRIEILSITCFITASPEKYSTVKLTLTIFKKLTENQIL